MYECFQIPLHIQKFREMMVSVGPEVVFIYLFPTEENVTVTNYQYIPSQTCSSCISYYKLILAFKWEIKQLGIRNMKTPLSHRMNKVNVH